MFVRSKGSMRAVWVEEPSQAMDFYRERERRKAIEARLWVLMLQGIRKEYLPRDWDSDLRAEDWQPLWCDEGKTVREMVKERMLEIESERRAKQATRSELGSEKGAA
jgi:hypothetical protein